MLTMELGMARGTMKRRMKLEETQHYNLEKNAKLKEPNALHKSLSCEPSQKKEWKIKNNKRRVQNPRSARVG